MSRSNRVIIARTPITEIIRPTSWYEFVFSILNKKHKRIMAAGIAVLNNEALITWV